MLLFGKIDTEGRVILKSENNYTRNMNSLLPRACKNAMWLQDEETFGMRRKRYKDTQSIRKFIKIHENKQPINTGKRKKKIADHSLDKCIELTSHTVVTNIRTSSSVFLGRRYYEVIAEQ